MKHVQLSLLALLLATLLPQVKAQNSIPDITILAVVPDTANHIVRVDFDLIDTENDPMEVWIQVSADSGRTWRVAIDSLSGDHGFPITSGTGKFITWHYQPATLSAYGSGLVGYRLRVVADDRQTIDLQTITDLVDSSRLHQDLLELQGIKHRTYGVQHLNDTKDSLTALLQANGLHPYIQGSPFGAYTCQNVIGRRSGTRRDSACWQISSHFDTVSNAPGGDDNATAVACVSEAVRVLSQFQTKESLRFFYFDLEEAGLIGSYQYVTSALPDWEDPKGLLNMDCVGYYSQDANSQVMPTGFNILFPAAYNEVEADSFRGNFLTSIVNTNSSWMDTVFVATAAAHVPGLKVITLETPGTGLLTVDLRRSDHAPFWDAGIPAIFFSDGANFRNPNYHTPNDTVGAINMDFYVKNVRAIVTTLARLAQLEHSDVEETGSFDVNVPVGLAQPSALALQPKLQVVPNPSDGRLEFRMEIPTAGNVRLELRNHHGQLVQVVEQGWREAGSHRLRYDQPLSQGDYAVFLSTEQGSAYHPLIIQR
ncbi:MAG TPA: M28 family peptidase [Bacteroidia bacterium]|nr:M28 family peptidase [Bacteroidia bacterium]